MSTTVLVLLGIIVILIIFLLLFCFYYKVPVNLSCPSNSTGKILKSASQPIFGPYLWISFHLIAENYPDTPNLATQNAAMKFISGIPWMLPCSDCGFHFKDYLDNEYLPEIESLENKLHIISSSRDELIKFFVEAHNNVTEHTNKTAKLWTVEEAKKYYPYGFRCVPNAIVPWETGSLKRVKGSKCVDWVHPPDEEPYCKSWKNPQTENQNNFPKNDEFLHIRL